MYISVKQMTKIRNSIVFLDGLPDQMISPPATYFLLLGIVVAHAREPITLERGVLEFLFWQVCAARVFQHWASELIFGQKTN